MRTALLLAHPLLLGVDASSLDGALERITVTDVPKGAIVGGPGLKQRLHLVPKGCLRAYKVTAEDRELLLELLPEGNFDGVLSMSGLGGHFTQAHTDATVASLELDTLERLIELDSKVASNLLRMIVVRLERRERQLETMTLNDPGRQLARQLLALADTVGRPDGESVALDPRITHQMLADMLGVRRETVTLHMGELIAVGAVEVHRGRFKLNPRQLRKIVRGPADRRTAA